MSVFDAGSAVGHYILDSSGWVAGTKTVEKSNKLISKSMAGIGIAVSAVGAVFVGAMTKSIASANVFQKEVGNVSTLLDTNVISMQGVAKGLLGLDSRLGDTTDLTKGLYQALSAGVPAGKDASNAIEFVATSAKFAKAALTDTTTAIDVLTTAQNAYGAETYDVTKISDIFFKTIEKGKTTGQELAGSLGASIPLFASMKIPLEELSAGLDAMTLQGNNAAESTTQLNAIVSAFVKPSEALTAAMQQYGIESGSALLQTQGLGGALEFLDTAANGNKETMAEFLPNIRALRGAMALSGQGASLFRSSLDALRMSAGATDIAFAKQELTYETFRNEANKLEIVVGNIGSAFTKQIAVGATDATKQMRQWLMSAKGMEAVASVTSVTAGSLAVTWELTKSLATAGEKFLSPVLGSLKEGFSLFAQEGQESNIIFNIFSGVVKNVTTILTIMGKQVAGLITNVSLLISTVATAGTAISQAFKGNWAEAGKAATEAGGKLIDVGLNIKDTWTDIGTTIVDSVSGYMDDVGKDAAELQRTYQAVQGSTERYVKSNWDELITGQKAFTGEYIAEIDKAVGKGKEFAFEQKNDFVNLADARKEWLGLVKTLGRTETEIKLEELNKQYAAYKQVAENQADVDQWYAEKRQEILEEAKSEEIAAWRDLGSFMFSQVAEIGSIVDGFYQNQIDKQQIHFQKKNADITAQYNKEINDLDFKLRNNIISEEQYAVEKELIEKTKADKEKAIEDEKNKKMNEIAKKQFQTKKGFSIASVWMDYATAVMGFWAAYGGIPIAGPVIAGIMTGVATGVAVANTALIASQKFVPAAQDGGTVTKEGMIRVDEQGGEIKRFKPGTVIIPNDVSIAMAEAAAAANETVMASKEEMRQDNIKFEINNPVIDNESRLNKLADKIIQILGRRKKFSVG